MKTEFLGQREGEEVILVFRRHVIMITKGIIALLILSVIGFLPFILMPNNEKLLFVAAGGIFIGLIIFLHHWINWYFSVYILTNKRIRQNIQKGLFHKSVLDIDLNKIMSAFIDVQGFWASLLNYGTIIIHTQVGDMRMRKIASAEDVYDKIQEEIAKVGYEDEE